MKSWFGGAGVLGIVYVGYLMTQLGFITEMVSAKQECETSALKALESPETRNADRIILEGCARAVRDADVAEKVMSKLP